MRGLTFGGGFARSTAALAVAALLTGTPAALAAPAVAVGPAVDVSASCSGQNAEVEQAVDTTLGYVYESWMGCRGIAFARSTDGGLTFEQPISVPGSVGSNVNAWDPAVTVAPDGTVYAAFMIARGSQWYPVVAASFDHGITFPQITPLVPPDPKNWGDRVFLATGPDGALYLTWDYGPERTSVTFLCSPTGSCGFATGDLNVVMQKSTDRGKSFGPMTYVSPGFPASGGDSAPMVVEPNGRIDVLYQGYQITDTTTYSMNPGYSYFTSSSDGGSTWSPPVRLGPSSGTMSLDEWWIDGDVAMDAGGNLYAVWDTQGADNDVGWLSFSTDHGRRWSAPVQVPPDRLNVPHVMEVAGGPAGIAYVSFFSSSDPRGYAEYLRPFSTTQGWLSDAVQVSPEFGDTSVWPGDTFGISALSPNRVVLSFGSATPSSGKKSDIFVDGVTVSTR
jgi:hypothetical protein